MTAKRGAGQSKIRGSLPFRNDPTKGQEVQVQYICEQARRPDALRCALS